MHRIILTTGGTGGHIFPALAVAEQIRHRYPDSEIMFIGSNYGPEKELAEKAGLPFAGLEVHGVLGRGKKAAGAFLQLAKAVPQAMKIIKNFRPDCMAGFGSYASFAGISAGILCRVPFLLHEQNAIPGTSNKILSKAAKKICISLPHTLGFDKSKCVYTGNPVRSSIGALGKNAGQRNYGQTKRLLVLGGSQGAHALNTYMVSALKKLKGAGVEIRHQTGDRDWEDTARAYERNGYQVDCARPFIDDMASSYEWADIVLCRSGASTVAEICAAGLPAIFVPFPAAIHDHQTKNAKILVEAHAAKMVPENEIEKTSDILLELFSKPDELAEMSKNSFALAMPDAAARVVDVLETLPASK